MTDVITLTGLVVRGRHGVFEQEKRRGQDFVIDVSVWMDLAPAAASDDLARTLNYAELADLVSEIVAGPARDLIETVAVEIAETALGRWPIDAIEVTVHKPQAPITQQFADVSVTVRRDAARRGGVRQGAAHAQTAAAIGAAANGAATNRASANGASAAAELGR